MVDQIHLKKPNQVVAPRDTYPHAQNKLHNSTLRNIILKRLGYA